MYCRLRTVQECRALEGRLPQRVYEEVLRGLAVLDPDDTESFSLVADTEEDIAKAREQYGDRPRWCEWSTRLGVSGYISVLYLLSNSCSVMFYTKEKFANEDILQNLED